MGPVGAEAAISMGNFAVKPVAARAKIDVMLCNNIDRVCIV